MEQSIITFEQVMESAQKYIQKKPNLLLIQKAYNFALLQHDGQLRQSGEPYITHPLEVAFTLSELGVGPNTLVAGLLHDVVEDTNTSLEDIAINFNPDIASLVDGLTKLNKLHFDSVETALAENHQKMLMAMANDVRVILVKLADRLHNMRTLKYISRDRQIKIANETLDIYAPIAHRLGMFRIKAELEDRALKYKDPQMYHQITNLIQNKRDEQDSLIDKVISQIKIYFQDNKLSKYEIKGRIKNIYSIYKKMTNQKRLFEDIYDILAIRIIVDKVENCYQALGIIHAHFVPIPKRFKDYIAVPKPNLYQSLHTTVVGEDGEIFEVQIRTKEMDKVAEVGIAAHWAYKENKVYSKEKEQFEIASKLKWYGELLTLTRENKGEQNAADFVDTIKGDILDANVYVFTPQSEVIALPKGSTPLDFAYKIHTDIGNKTVGAIINNRIMPLNYELLTGDIVSIKTSKKSFGPSGDWLKIVKTSHAKTKIKNFLNKQNHDLTMQTGKDEIEKEIYASKANTDLNDAFVKKFFNKNKIETVEDLYIEVGKKNISSKTVIAKMLGVEVSKEQTLQKQMERNQRVLQTNNDTGVVVEGLPNPQIRLGNCCNPIPGDKIVGYVSKGSGIIVHTNDCNNLISLDENRLIEVYWDLTTIRKFPCRIKITANNKNNVFSSIINTINASDNKIVNISANNKQNNELIVKTKLITTSKVDLEKLIINLKKLNDVYQIERDNK